MQSFAIIAEGVTDQAVLENILLGFFGDGGDEPVVNFFHPERDATSKAPGGWTLVLRALRQGKHREALQLNDYLVLHLDTDVCEETGYDVSRRSADGQSLTVEQLIEQVMLRLVKEMGADFTSSTGDGSCSRSPWTRSSAGCCLCWRTRRRSERRRQAALTPRTASSFA